VVEEAAELLLAGEKRAEVGGGGVGFDLFLHGVEFSFNVAAAQSGETALRFFPGGIGSGREGDFEEQAAVFFVERGGQCGGFGSSAVGDALQKGREDFFGLEALVEMVGDEGSSDFFAESVGIEKHLQEATLSGLSAGGDEFGFGFDFAAPLGGSAT